MALGVLNNLSAIYAENNLNNTSNSLQKVLQQLSSGSKINSGADDSAGLSLVNGLQANSTALAQSETNATEGVGLLQVADGALSQVTNLLDRAITLATEASNGTLNTSQEAAANQEYTSIMSEVNNIGSTTTYNQQQVFGSGTVAIYTGDSSLTGSSIDDLNIHSLSQSTVGDTGGAMAYSNGQDNVFLNLSTGTKNASAGDSLNASGATTITVNYLAKGAGSTSNLATANISVGSGTTYANTAQGLINAINASGLGLNASFSTAAQAGSAAVAAALAANTSGGSASNTGIEISGTAVGTGTTGAGNIGTLTVANTTDTLGGSLTIVGSDGKSHAITLGTTNSTDTLAHLMATINSDGLGVVASTNAGIVDGHAPGTVMTLTASSAAITATGTNITDTATTAASATLGGLDTLAALTVASQLGTVTVNNKFDTLTGSLAIAGTDGVSHTVTLGTVGSTDTLANLANYINTNPAFAASNLSASVDSTGTTLSISTTAAVAATKTASIVPTALAAVNTAGSVYLTGTPTLSTPFGATVGTLTATAIGAKYSGGLLNLGPNGGIALGVAGSTDTIANIMNTVNNGNYGVTASLNTTAVGSNAIGTILTFTSANASDTFSVTGATFSSGGVASTVGVQNPNQIGTLALGTGQVGTTLMAAGDVISFNNGAISYTVPAGGQTMTQVAAAITALNDGITATATNTSASTAVMTFVSTSTSTLGVGVSFAPATVADAATGLYTVTTDTPSTANSGFYGIGITGSITDSSTNGGTANTGLVSNSNGNGGIATTSYTDGSGANLSNSDLLSQSDAQATLAALATAITDVASMDGYIGAQINTLNSVSQVMTTQQENVTSAQNAIQATDYASATAAMSKYEILSQTGIAALAQANTVQQEVTKLLQ